MLLKSSDLLGAAIQATDGDIGRVEDLYFDDRQWTTRYFVANTGSWLPSRLVLLSPASLRGFDLKAGTAFFDLSRQQIENSPDIDSDQPVSRQHEIAFAAYYGLPGYWPAPMLAAPEEAPVTEGDPSLRSVLEVLEYYIQAVDGELGHVEEFLVDERTWQIRYLIVDTRNWWPGKKVPVAPQWVHEVDWPRSTVHLELSRDAIQNAPEYDPSRPIDAEYEERLRTITDEAYCPERRGQPGLPRRPKSRRPQTGTAPSGRQRRRCVPPTGIKAC